MDLDIIIAKDIKIREADDTLSDEKNANDLIPKLIFKINKYSSRLKDRVKIYSMFQEFDSYAHMNLQNFIKMSEKRYKSIKSGNNLRNILMKQKKENSELSKKILANELYSDKNIETEKKKLYKKLNNKESKEIYQIRYDIISSTKDLSKKELEKREKYLKAAQRSRNMKEQKIKKRNLNKNENNKNNTINVPSFDSSKRSRFVAKSMNWNLNRTFRSKNKNTNELNNIDLDNLNKDKKNKIMYVSLLDKEKEFLKQKKEFFDNLVRKDEENLKENFDDYHQFLKDMNSTKDSNFSKIINNGSNFGHTYSFKINDIKLLSYQEEKKEEENLGQKENPDVDIVKLMKYTKRGNRKWFLNNIKQRSLERRDSYRNKLKNKKFMQKSNSTTNLKNKNNINFKKIYDDNLSGIDDETNLQFKKMDSNSNLMGKTGSTTFTNFKNTIKTVKNEADMVKNIGRNFINKRKTMEGFFKRMNLPKIEEYEKMFKTRNNFKKYNKKGGAFTAEKEKVSPKFSKKSVVIAQNNPKDQLINYKILADMQRTYESKKKIWEKEDMSKENIRRKKLEHIEETKKYLKELKKIKRTPHLYVDPYSKRDDLINNRIRLFSRSLSGPFYSKKKIESRLDDFNNYIEQKELEKKKFDDKMAETMKEREMELKEENEEFQLKQKIKINLEKENLNKSGIKEIKLNYKYVPTFKAVKKKDKDKSYKDYQEIYEIVKNKPNNKNLE